MSRSSSLPNEAYRDIVMGKVALTINTYIVLRVIWVIRVNAKSRSCIETSQCCACSINYSGGILYPPGTSLLQIAFGSTAWLTLLILSPLAVP